MSDVQLGKLIAGAQQRDAIHIAVAPVVAAVYLNPGQLVGFVDACSNVVGPSDNPIGIIDPYLKQVVPPKLRCWMLLLPGTITGLRHEWTHPAFPVDAPPTETPAPIIDKAASEAFLQRIANICDMSLEELLDHARRFLSSGDRETQYGGQSWQDSIYEEGPNVFWMHYERFTGMAVSADDRDDNPFSCSC